MKRSKQKQKSKPKTSQQQVQDTPTPKGNRRDFLVNTAIYGTGAAVFLGSGAYFATGWIAAAGEGDISTLGNGVPAVVQLHDPNCPTCNQLRKEARDAACDFGECELQFRVINITSEEGRRLATANNTGNVTLLLMDGEGNVRNILPGMNEAENLKPVFERHARRYAKA